jgi:hypothetical protein
VRKEFVSNGEDSFWAFCIEFLDGALLGLLNRCFSLGAREWFFPAVNAGAMAWRVTILPSDPAPFMRAAHGAPLQALPLPFQFLRRAFAFPNLT